MYFCDKCQTSDLLCICDKVPKDEHEHAYTNKLQALTALLHMAQSENASEIFGMDYYEPQDKLIELSRHIVESMSNGVDTDEDWRAVFTVLTNCQRPPNYLK